MLKEVVLKNTVREQDFLRFLDSSQEQELLSALEKLKGKKVVHVNATAKGGGVAELLKSTIPYMRSVGIDASWYVIDPKKASKAFFAFTNNLHNALQGSIQKFSEESWDQYMGVNKEIAQDLDDFDYDMLVIHDPQPLAAVHFLKNTKPRVCVIHIDTSTPDPIVSHAILDLVKRYNKIMFSNKVFVNKGMPQEKVRYILPAIDPIAPKQNIVPSKEARLYLQQYGISSIGPLLVQVSRFDVWKNPHGVIAAFWLLEKKYPTLQIMLVGFQEARDNPQAEKVYMDIRAMVGKNPRIFLFFDPKRIGSAKNIETFTAMAQNGADIIIQNSVKEGFGLTVTEAMWKGKPTIGGPASGIREQITHKKNGYIAANTKELAAYLDYLLSNPNEGLRIGRAAQESVRKNFLMSRFVLDHLKVYKEII